jgi:RNA 3'-terminal phosphate cyclase (ATP)
VQSETVTLDGKMGEGGGQILRTALSLSCVTGRPLHIWDIRGGRSKPGLLHQHRCAVSAVAEITGAKVKGNHSGSRELRFVPGPIQAGEYRFAVGTAGSACLVFQTVLPVLLHADGPSQAAFEGGTHNQAAPPFDFLDRVFLPRLTSLGPKVKLRLDRYGFFPRGGGRFRAEIEPAAWNRLELTERGTLEGVRARGVVAGLPRNIAERELRVIQRKLEWDKRHGEVDEAPERQGPGNVCMAEMRFQHVTELFTGFGRKGIRAEAVATECVKEAKRYLATEAPVGEHLADQLLLPLALGAGGTFRTVPPVPHTTTNAAVIREFLPDVRIALTEQDDGTTVISVTPPG